MKKLTAALLALVMLLGLTMTAGAENSKTGSIKITGAHKGAAYTLYRVLDIEGADYPTESNYRYKMVSAWENFFESDAGKDYVEIDHEKYVTWKKQDGTEEERYKAFAAAVVTYANKNNISYDKQITVADGKDGVAAGTDGSYTVTFSNLPIGFYVLSSDAGTNPISFNVDKSSVVEIAEKNEAPTVEKTIVEDSAEKKANSASIGDTVTYKTTITAQAGAKNYVLHDKMDAGLTFQRTVAVTKGTELVSADGNYELEVPSSSETALEDGCTFHVKFTQTFCAALNAGEKITVTYSAVLNENATTGGEDPNTNETWLKYGENSETIHEKTDTYTYQFQIVKTDGGEEGGNSYEVLNGAKFKLYAQKDGGAALKFSKSGSGENEIYTVSKEPSAVEEIEAGTPVIKGLEEGTYYLEEIEAPDGYNKVPGRTEVEIKDKDNVVSGGGLTETNGIVTYVYGEGGVHVINHSGAMFPGTGGIGTTIFYVGGLLLVIAAGAGLLLLNRRHRDTARKG